MDWGRTIKRVLLGLAGMLTIGTIRSDAVAHGLCKQEQVNHGTVVSAKTIRKDTDPLLVQKAYELKEIKLNRLYKNTPLSFLVASRLYFPVYRRTLFRKFFFSKLEGDHRILSLGDDGEDGTAPADAGDSWPADVVNPMCLEMNPIQTGMLN